jgi:hypothetical protein
MTPDLYQAAVDCELSPGQSVGTQALAAETFPFTVTLDVRRCLNQRLENFLNQAVVEAKLNHVDGCKTLADNQQVQSFRENMRKQFTQQFVQHITQARANQDYYRHLEQYYKILAERAVPLQLMTRCYGESDERGCYSQAIDNLIDEIIPSGVVNSEALLVDLRLRFLQAYSFDAVKAENVKLHQDFLFSQSAILNRVSEELWEKCLTAPTRPGEPMRSGPFSVGTEFMELGQYNCLNTQIAQAVQESLKEMSFAGLVIQDGNESKLLVDLAIPMVVKELQTFYSEARKSEELDLARFVKVDLPAGQEKLLRDFSWVKLESSFSSACADELRRAAPQNVRYHDQRAFIERPIASACQQVITSTAFTQWVRTQEGYARELLREAYLSQVERLGVQAAEECIRKNNSDNPLRLLIQTQARRVCFTWEWRGVQSKAWTESIKQTGINSVSQAQLKSLTQAEVDAIEQKIRREKL